MLHVVHGTLGAVTDPQAPEAAPLHLEFRLGRITMDPHRIIYATIMLMTTYAIYDEGTDPLKAGPIIEIIGLSLAPLFALAMAHAFSDGLDMQIRNGRRLTRHDRWHLFGTNLQYLYVAIPPTIVITVLGILGMDANDIIGFVQVLGLISLGWWGYYAGRKAGLGRARRWVFAINYSLLGMLIILVELILTH
jgi:hypothetical protein